MTKLYTLMVKDIVEYGFTEEDGDKLTQHLNKALEMTDEVIVDFEGVVYFTTHFYSHFFSILFTLGLVEYNRRVHPVGFTASGSNTYLECYDYAVAYYRRQKQEVGKAGTTNLFEV